ncbi:MAG: DUF938 domain-containing protein [Leptolyngbya sp. SIO4C1]|nr:DUF938 domain-containing protein [Leptolyngbya sp. SIO4C1]
MSEAVSDADRLSLARQYAPATERNREPILAVLAQVLPPTGTILETASGTGQHAAYFAPRLMPRYWLPSDPQPLLRASIQAWAETAASDRLLSPVALDVSAPRWPVEAASFQDRLTAQGAPAIAAIVNINMIHISPWQACLGLLAGASRILPAAGVLYLYGPYQRQGRHTAPSNAAFDKQLRSQNPAWGVRSLEAVTAAAEAQQLQLQTVVEMPANNLSVVFAKKS